MPWSEQRRARSSISREKGVRETENGRGREKRKREREKEPERDSRGGMAIVAHTAKKRRKLKRKTN